MYHVLMHVVSCYVLNTLLFHCHSDYCHEFLDRTYDNKLIMLNVQCIHSIWKGTRVYGMPGDG